MVDFRKNPIHPTKDDEKFFLSISIYIDPPRDPESKEMWEMVSHKLSVDIPLLQIPRHPQDVALGAQHLPRGPAQAAPHEEAALRAEVRSCVAVI